MTDEVTLTGLYLTLVGLLASFFWLNLGGWIRDLTSLQSEASAIENWTGADANKEKLAIKHKLTGLRNVFQYVLVLSVAAFAIFLLVQSLVLLDDVAGEAASSLSFALWVFLILYILLTAALILRGMYLISDTSKKLQTSK